VNAFKANSSRWVHDEIARTKIFTWQEGYGAFSVSRSNEPAVAEYIRRRKEHHRKRDFKAEFLDLLERHGIEYDPRSIWK